MSQNLEHPDDTALRSPHRYPPSPNVSESNDTQDQAQLEFIDGSEAIFNMYLEISLKEDKEMVEGWNQDAKSILLFSGLFSATVAAALGPSSPNLVLSSPDVSATYLQLIYTFLASSFPNSPAILTEEDITFLLFGPVGAFQLVNSLWYSSLTISLTCALLAILLQQWTRRYLMAVQQWVSPHNRARIRGLFAEGVRNSGIPLLVDVMWASHQLSFLLFTLGLLVYFFNTDKLTFSIILTWILLWTCLYLWMSIVGILRKNSPYYTPLSSLIHRLPHRKPTPTAPYDHTRNITRAALWNPVEEISRTRKVIEESAQKSLQGRDSHTLKWTFDSLHQDHQFERFFAGVPDFCNSRAVANPVDLLLELNEDKQKLSRALAGFMHQTVTSRLISEPTRERRIKTCAKAIEAVPALASWLTLRRVFGEWEAFLGSVDFGSAVLRTGDHNSDSRTVFCARCIAAIVIARARVHDSRWINLITQFLTSDMKLWVYISQPTLQGYPDHGYRAPLQLANLIFVTRVMLQFYSRHQQDTFRDTSDVLFMTLIELSSDIDVRDVSSEMRLEYCNLWNDLVRLARAEAQDGTGSYTPKIAADILKHLRKSHIKLHESTDTSLAHTSDENVHFSPLGSSYPLCSIQDHSCTSSQTPPLITTNHTDTPSLCSSLSAPQSAIPASVTGATEDATPGLAVAPSTPESSGFPLDAHSLVKTTNVQESYGQTGTPPSVIVDSLLLSPSDAPVVQPDRLGCPAPNTGPSTVSELFHEADDE